MDIKTILIEEEVNQRIDKYLPSIMPNFSRTQVQMMLDDKLITVNDNIIKASYILKLGDVIKITMLEASVDEVKSEDIPLDIYYEDKDVIVINKPSGMVVHPASGNYEGTLVNALLHHCKDLSGINGVLRPGIVHRIDKETSGLLVACKNDFSHRELSKQFLKKSVTRKYDAIVYGVINHNFGKVDAPIARDPNNRKLMGIVEGGKNAVTNFKVIERFKDFTHLELALETGRTHQIRVHLKYIDHPVVGDPQYGPKKIIGNQGQFLHAKTLGFIHPRTNEYMEWISPLPDYFTNFLSEIKKDSE
jgi:23S rRNA pseudouridine1911/1915/1917 synthase